MIALDLAGIAQAVGALVAVLGLLMVFAWVLRLVRHRTTVTAGGRLKVAETLALDSRHRLLRVTDGEQEHLLLLGPAGSTVVRSQRPAPLQPAGDD